jgi:hypothetical protein
MAAPVIDQPASISTSVLHGERRVQLPLEEAARLLGISGWLAHASELPTNRIGRNLHVPVAVLRRVERGLPLAEGRVA